MRILMKNWLQKILVSLLPLLLTANVSLAESPSNAKNNEEIKIGDRVVGTVGQVRIDKNEEGSRIVIEVNAEFPSFARKVDEILKAKGNLGGCQERYFWRGNTRLHRGGQTLKVTSRLGFEAWTCPRPIRLPFGGQISIPRARVFGDARDVNWTLFIEQAPIESLHVSARVDNIVGWPDWFEDILGVRITEKLAVEIPEYCGTCRCSEVADSLRPEFETVDFQISPVGTLRASAVFSVEDHLLTELLRCS